MTDVRVERSETMSRAEAAVWLNALSAAVEQALGDALAGDDVRRARCVVLTGSGRAFSAVCWLR